MTSIGTFLRMFGAAILLIAVQFASVAAEAHAGHGHGADGHGLESHGAVAGAAHSVASDETAAANRAERAQPAAQAQPDDQAEATVRSAPGARLSGSDACVMGCCGCTGCCAAALAAVSPHLPPKVCSPRIGFARVIAVSGADPRGLRKPPRSLA
ncbi:MAG: hypothetical protein ACXW3N_14015, partial [Rhodoplanes sp.]